MQVEVPEVLYQQLHSDDSSVKEEATRTVLAFAHKYIDGTKSKEENPENASQKENKEPPSSSSIKEDKSPSENASQKENKEPPSSSSIKEDKSPSESFLWNDKDTKALFYVRSEMEEEFSRAKNHQTLWAKVTSRLAEMGPGPTANAQQCQNKWKNMKKEFMKAVDNNSKTGEEPKKCKFFTEFSEMYGCKVSTQPEFTLASCSENSLVSKPSTSSTTSSCNDSPVAKKKRRKVVSPTLGFLKDYAEKQEALNKKREDDIARRHAEKMNSMEKLLNIFEKIANKN